MLYQLLVGSTDAYNHIYYESLWWKLLKIIRGHKYQDKDNDKNNDNDKDTDIVPEKNNICYIFEILRAYSFQM